MTEMEMNGTATKAKPVKAKVVADKPISLPKFDKQTIRLTLIGESPLIVHRWTEKAKKEILDKQRGVPSKGREKKDPVADFLGTLYTIQRGTVVGDFDGERTDDDQPNVRIEGGKFGFPSVAFKSAVVDACTSLGKQAMTKVAARQAFHVLGELSPINGQPRMREDMVRVGMDKADIRHRAEFVEWSAELTVSFNPRVISQDQLLSLFNLAGFAVGVGEWRPEKNGCNGLFRVG